MFLILVEREEQDEMITKNNDELLSKFKKMSPTEDEEKGLGDIAESDTLIRTKELINLSEVKNEKSSLYVKQSSSSTKKPRYETQTSHDLTFFLQQQKEGAQRTLITPQIRFVMFQFLITTVKPFTNEFLTKNVLELIFKRAVFKESRRPDTKSPSEYLYTYIIYF